jgi:hypothetical protein
MSILCVFLPSVTRTVDIYLFCDPTAFRHTLFAAAGAFAASWDEFLICILKQSVLSPSVVSQLLQPDWPSSSVWLLTFQFVAGTRQQIHMIIINSQCRFLNYKIMCHVNLLSGAHFIQSSWLHCVGGCNVQIKQNTVMHHSYIAQCSSCPSHIPLPGLMYSAVFVWHVYAGLTWQE